LKRIFFLFFFFFIYASNLPGQVVADTIPGTRNDSSGIKPGIDSAVHTLTDSLWLKANDSASVLKKPDSNLLLHQPGTIQEPERKFSGNPFYEPESNEWLFYFLIFLLLLFSLLRKLFPKYFIDLFRLFFRTTLKQRQIREQLMQTPLPSLIFNGFFMLCAALYADLLLQHFQLLQDEGFWLLYLYCLLTISGIYLVKYMGLKIAGWLFGVSEAADLYVFIVFIVNKMTGVFLLPFLVLLSFSEGNIYSISLTLSWIGIGVLLLYRIILTYSAVHNQIKVNLFHFILYLVAFEITPLLLIYKFLLLLFH
jgi:hypothetical protein